VQNYRCHDVYLYPVRITIGEGIHIINVVVRGYDMLPNDILSLFSREARGQLIEHEKNRGPLEEIRVRLLESLECIVRDGFFELNYIVDDTQFRMILDQLFQSSRYRFTRELQECFVTLSWGIG